MDKQHFLFRIRPIALACVLWELVFWGLGWLILELFGALDQGQAGLEFRFPGQLDWLWLLIPVHAAFFVLMIRKNKVISQLGNASILAHLIPEVSSFRMFMQFFLIRNALVFTILAMAQPALGTKRVTAKRDSSELVLVVDLSNSMYARDAGFEYSRLEIMKHGLDQLMNRLHGEKIGLVVFAGNAYVQLPLTHDYGSAQLFIRELNPDMISEQGTNLELAFSAALGLFSKEEHPRNLLLITDGESHEGHVSDVLTKVKDAQISVGIIGIGSEKGSFVPNDPERPEMGYKRDAAGQRVISRLNSKMIYKLASQAGGMAQIARKDFPDFASVVDQLHHSGATELSQFDVQIKENYYQIPLFFACFLWLFFLLHSVIFPVQTIHRDGKPQE